MGTLVSDSQLSAPQRVMVPRPASPVPSPSPINSRFDTPATTRFPSETAPAPTPHGAVRPPISSPTPPALLTARDAAREAVRRHERYFAAALAQLEQFTGAEPYAEFDEAATWARRARIALADARFALADAEQAIRDHATRQQATWDRAFLGAAHRLLPAALLAVLTDEADAAVREDA